MDTCSPSTPPAEPSAVGYFSVPPQGAITAARYYPVADGTASVAVVTLNWLRRIKMFSFPEAFP